MEARFWHERWGNDQIAFHRAGVNPHLERFWRERGGQIVPATVFVPLCGKSHDLLWLARQGHRVIGIELSPVAVEAFFSEQKLAPTVTVSDDANYQCWVAGSIMIYCGDFFALDAAHLTEVQRVYDRASLIAMPPDMRRGYSDHLHSIVPPMADMLLISLEYEQTEMKGPPFAVPESDVRELFGPNYQVELLLRQECLADNQRFRDKGLSWLNEAVYELTPKGS